MEKHLDNVREEKSSDLEKYIAIHEQTAFNFLLSNVHVATRLRSFKKNLQFIASIYTSVLKLVVRIANRFDAV